MLMREGDKPFRLKSKENELLPRILHSREPIKSLSLEPRLIGTCKAENTIPSRITVSFYCPREIVERHTLRSSIFLVLKHH
jgi:hypothetical protein